jgi:hypothetical protein
MDLTVNQIDKGKLTYALNANLENFDASSVNYQNEQGNKLCLNFPDGYKLIGEHFIQEKNKHIFFLANPLTGGSEIGYMDNNDCVYHTLSTTYADLGITVEANSPCLNFSINNPIHKAVHKISNCNTEVYWTDGVNPRRYIDIEKVPYISTIGENICEVDAVAELDCNKLKIQPNFNIPELAVNDVINGGELTAGMYQFAIQYCSALGEAYTSYYSVTNPTPIANPQLTTANFDYVVGRSVVLDISNIDVTGYFEYYNIAVIKTVNGASVVQLVGTYFIDGTTNQITYTGQNQTAISLSTADILFKNPYYDVANDLTAVQDVLVWDNLTSIDRTNYQKIANQIDLLWETYKIPSNENYANALNSTNLRGYMRDEIYAFEIVFLLKNGKQTDGFHIPGRAATIDDLVIINKADNTDYIGTGTSAPYWKIYNTASVIGNATGPKINNATPYQYGQFGYWESTETYPCNPNVWGNLADQPIRHHKFPDVLVSPIFESGAYTISPNFKPVMQQNAVYPIGVKVSTEQVLNLINLSDLTDLQKSEIAGFKIVRGDRSTNRSIVAKGMLRDIGKYTRDIEGPDSTYYYYANYPYNDLKPDPFLLNKNNAYNSQCVTYKITAGATSGSIEYTDCYTNEPASRNFLSNEIWNQCSLTLPQVTAGSATIVNITGQSYTLTCLDRGGLFINVGTLFEYTDSETLLVITVLVPFNRPRNVNSTTLPKRIAGATKYNIQLNTSYVNTYCYPEKLDGFNYFTEPFRYVFNSPETSFGQPTLGNVLRMENAIYGAGRAHFVKVKDNAQYKLLSAQAQVDALNSSYNIANLTGTLDATAMFTAFQAYLQLYINGINRRNYAYSFNSIATYDYGVPVNNDLGVKQRELDICQYLIPGVQSVGDDINVNNFQRESSVYLKTSTNVSAIPRVPDTPNLIVSGQRTFNDNSRFTISEKGNCGSPEMQEDITVLSYYGSIKNIFVNQWGQIYSYQTIDTGFQRMFDNLSSSQPDVAFGGDTFISKFAYKTKLPFFIDNRVGAPDDSDVFYDEIGNVGYPRYWHSSRSILSNYVAGTTVLKNIISVKAHNFDCANDPSVPEPGVISTTTTSSTIPPSGTVTVSTTNAYYDGKFYLFAYGIPYFYVESAINVDLRQAFNNLEGDFYPHVSTGIPDNWLQQTNVPIAFDNTYTYNVTYSKQNRENVFSHLPVDWSPELCYTNYPFRAIYSEQQSANPSNRVNSWLNYAPVAFFDFPQNFGKLVSLDGIQNKAVLARFENKSLLYNTLLTINTSNPQAAYLGNPSLFRSSPPIDFAETDLGYVGSQNKMLLKIPQGQITIDAKRGQIFLISGNQAIDLSAFGSGVNRFMTDHLAFEILNYYPNADTDNHFNGIGIHGVYDSKYDRVIISKLDYVPQVEYRGIILYDEALDQYYINKQYGTTVLRKYVDLTDIKYFCNKSWTLSFSMNTKSWVSFHSYIPNFYIAENNFFYSGLNEGCDLAALAFHEITTTTTTSTSTTASPSCNLSGIAVFVPGVCEMDGVAISVDSCELNGTAQNIPPTTTTTTTLPCQCWTVVNEDVVTINYTVTNCDGSTISPNILPGGNFNHCIQAGSVITVNSPIGGLLGEYNCNTTCLISGTCPNCEPTTTTTTTTTATPLDFTIGYDCSDGNITVSGSNIIGGVGPYEFGTTYFLSEAAALANTSWVAFISISYGVGTADGTFWIVVKDSVGTLKAKSITTECNTTTTTTTSTSTSTTTTTSTSTSTTTTTTTVITDYYYYDLQSCTTSETSPGYSIYSGLSGVFVIGPADCYSIVSQVGSGTLPSGVDLDVLTNVISCSDPLCVS